MNDLFNLPLLNEVNTQLVIWLVAVDVALLLFVVFFVIRYHVKKSAKAQINNDDWLMAVGGKENIKEVSAVGSRLSINFLDKEKIDREKLKTLGVSSVLVMSNKVTLVIEGKAEKIAESLKQSL